jgi:sporulation protein YlmC with PRC-barrel domain
MRSWYRVALVFACMIAPNLVSAENGSANENMREAANAAAYQDLHRGSKIIGADVRDPRDKKLGEIKDILLDSGRGEVAFVVVSFAAASGLPGRRYHAIPWKALQPGDDGKHYVLYADRETISNGPGFEHGKWPDLADQKWSSEVDGYWSRMVGQGPPGSITTSSGTSGARGNGSRP